MYKARALGGEQLREARRDARCLTRSSDIIVLVRKSYNIHNTHGTRLYYIMCVYYGSMCIIVIIIIFSMIGMIHNNNDNDNKDCCCYFHLFSWFYY